MIESIYVIFFKPEDTLLVLNVLLDFCKITSHFNQFSHILQQISVASDLTYSLSNIYLEYNQEKLRSSRYMYIYMDWCIEELNIIFHIFFPRKLVCSVLLIHTVWRLYQDRTIRGSKIQKQGNTAGERVFLVVNIDMKQQYIYILL